MLYLFPILLGLIISPPKNLTANQYQPSSSSSSTASQTALSIQNLEKQRAILQGILDNPRIDDQDRKRYGSQYDKMDALINSLKPQPQPKAEVKKSAYPRQKQISKTEAILAQHIERQVSRLEQETSLKEANELFTDQIEQNITNLKAKLVEQITRICQAQGIKLTCDTAKSDQQNAELACAMWHLHHYASTDIAPSLLIGYKIIITYKLQALDLISTVAELINETLLVVTGWNLTIYQINPEDHSRYQHALYGDDETVVKSRLEKIYNALTYNFECIVISHYNKPLAELHDAVKDLRILEAIASLIRTQPDEFYKFINSLNYHVLERACDALFSLTPVLYQKYTQIPQYQHAVVDKISCATTELKQGIIPELVYLINIYYKMLSQEYALHNMQLPASTQSKHQSVQEIISNLENQLTEYFKNSKPKKAVKSK